MFEGRKTCLCSSFKKKHHILTKQNRFKNFSDACFVVLCCVLWPSVLPISPRARRRWHMCPALTPSIPNWSNCSWEKLLLAWRAYRIAATTACRNLKRPYGVVYLLRVPLARGSFVRRRTGDNGEQISFPMLLGFEIPLWLAQVTSLAQWSIGAFKFSSQRFSIITYQSTAP